MSEPSILDRIDATLDDYDQWDGHSPDAARWAEGEWVDARKPGPGSRQRVIVGDFELPQHISLTMERMAELADLHMTEWQRIVAQAMVAFGDFAGRQCWKCRRWHYGDGVRCDTCWPKHAQRPQAAAERTTSARRLAGSRRTKRQARRRG